HHAITREQDEGVPLGFSDEMFDPMLERIFIAVFPRVRHFADNEHFHLLIEVERTAELQRHGFFRAHPFSKIGQIFSSHPQSGTGHDAGAAITKKDLPQSWRNIDRRGIEGEELSDFPSPLYPVNVIAG